MKAITINADDFGLNLRCTEAICQAFSDKLITDTSFVANGDAFDDAIERINEYSLCDQIGIHFNITEGHPLTKEICECSSFVKDGVFHGNINRYKKLSKEEKHAVYTELSAQIERIEAAGVIISHADSHHHIHTAPYLTHIILRVCKEHGINKIRIHRNCGEISAPRIWVKNLYNTCLRFQGFRTTRLFGSLSDVAKAGIADSLEIMVHPDYDINGILIDRDHSENGYPVGAVLNLPKGEYRLRRYSEL